MSLGVDPISCDEKICNFDCTYCQLGKTQQHTNERKVFVPTQNIINEIKELPEVKIDHVTFSGRGEPTLAKNLGEMIKEVRLLRQEKIAVITNSSLMTRLDVQQDLSLADFVLAKLDASDEKIFQNVNQPSDALVFDQLVDAMHIFKKDFKGKFALQIMLLEENKNKVEEIANLARKISPDEVQLNTPLRPCGTKPLTRGDLNDIKKAFDGLYVVSVYDLEQKQYHPFDEKKTTSRHGQFRK
ncbi:MAG: radical SAM protein [Candidatus Aceula meridiana]|nr:radical SAM protein [Candidatus Aceula meridiana]